MRSTKVRACRPRTKARLEGFLKGRAEADAEELAKERLAALQAEIDAHFQNDPALGFTKEEIEALLSNEGVFTSSDKSELQSPHSVLLSARLKLQRSLEARK